MKIVCLLPCLFAVAVLCTPAKRNCPQQKCVNATDSCGAPFSECWDECSLGSNERPTFVAPPCSVSNPVLLFTALGTAPATAPNIPPHITSAPSPLATPPTDGCKSEFTICIDYLKPCANGTYSIPYGGCHDACSTDKVYTAPLCTKTWAALAPTSTKTKTKKPSVTRPACNNAKSFMCAPLNWLL